MFLMMSPRSMRPADLRRRQQTDLHACLVDHILRLRLQFRPLMPDTAGYGEVSPSRLDRPIMKSQETSIRSVDRRLAALDMIPGVNSEDHGSKRPAGGFGR